MHSALKNKMVLIGGLMAGVALTIPLASAEEVVIFKSVPSSAEINEVLFGKDAAAPDGPRVRSLRITNPSSDAMEEKTRAIRLHNPAQGTPEATPVAVNAQDAAISAPKPAPAPAATTSAAVDTQDAAVSAPEPAPAAEASSGGVGLGFNLQFAFDSVDLLPDSKAYIDRLGEVLGEPDNVSKQILIVGHTDGSGEEVYNTGLSERRALAVRDYLTTAWNIDANLLRIEAAGENQPLGGTDPLDGINRRVEFFSIN